MSDKMSVDDGAESDTGKLEKVTIEAARDRVSQLIEKGFTGDIPALIEALPAVGKSYGVIKWAATSGEPVSIFTERHELYDQYEEWATEEFDLTAQQLPVFHHDCPTVATTGNESRESGDTSVALGSEESHERLRDQILSKYEQGVSGRELHQRASDYFDKQLPCQKNGSCPYMQALEQDHEDTDVLIGNFQQVFSEAYRKGRYIVFDEFPSESFVHQFNSTTVSTTVSNFVSRNSQLPFQNWRDVLTYSNKNDTKPAVKEWLEQHSHDRDTEPLYKRTNSQIDSRGPLLTEIGVQFQELDNSWRRADLGDGRVAVQSPKDNQLTILDPPPTNESKGVIALDGTPCVEMWELLLNENLVHHSVFTADQKREFLRNVLGLKLIQTANSTKPYGGGSAVTPDKDMALIESIEQRESQEPSLISSLAAIKDGYKKRNVGDLIDDWENYNNLKGSGQFATKRLGIILGCPQPSDNRIKRWGALAGHSITPATDENGNRCTGRDLDFGDFGNLILQDMRENEVLQAAMRFGREASDGERGATVYIHTAAIPEWVQPERSIPKIHAWSDDDGVIKVIKEIKRLHDWEDREWKTTELAKACEGLTKKQIRNILRDTLSDQGYIEFYRGGQGNAYHWSNLQLEDVGDNGIVEW